MDRRALHVEYLAECIADVSQLRPWRALLLDDVPSHELAIVADIAPLPQHLRSAIETHDLKFTVRSTTLSEARTAHEWAAPPSDCIVFLFEATEFPEVFAESFNVPQP